MIGRRTIVNTPHHIAIGPWFARLGIFMLVGCQPPMTTPNPFPTLAPVSPSPFASSSPAPSASAVVYLNPNTLPPASLEEEDATSICDPEANQFDPNAGATVPCDSGTVLGLRALHLEIAQVDRIYLRRMPCQQMPCSTTELSVITVTGWSGDRAMSVVYDNEHFTITAPVPDPLALWPSPQPVEPPPVERVDIAGAPREVRERDPYPYCGEAPDGPSPIRTCFRAAVLDGRPVEMIDHNIVTGDIWVMRFDGQGLLWRYGEAEGGGWFRDRGSMILGIDAERWDYLNWVKAEPVN